MSILISHELPINYLEYSQFINDYEYCLVHLCDEHEKYLDFYKDAVKDGREVILDNSIFELGAAFDSTRFAERIEEIKPTWYIVPDVLEDGAATIENWKSFIEDHGKLPGMRIGVAQGRDLDEFIDCYKFMAEHADYIAISFDYSWYEGMGGELPLTKLEKWCYGRCCAIQELIELDVWAGHKPHHLLGCSLAKEFGNHIKNRSIRSLDTSNPITAALDGKRYLKRMGLMDKSKVKLADQINVDFDLDTLHKMYYNTDEFRRIATIENYGLV